MKKVVLTAVGMMLVAVAAHAQSPRVEVMMTSNACKGALCAQARPANKKQPQTKIPNTLQRRVAQQVERANQKAVAKVNDKATTAKKVVANQPKAKRGTIGQWIRAAVLGGPFPGESSAQYHQRLVAQSQPAALPFK